MKPSTCRFCGCTEAYPCAVPPYASGDECGWVSGTNGTVCTAPPCLRAWAEYRVRQKHEARRNRLTSQKVHELIRGRRRKKKGKAA